MALSGRWLKARTSSWEIDEKHRVSVLRAIKRIASSGALPLHRATVRGKRSDFWYNEKVTRSSCTRFIQKFLARNIRFASASEPRPRKSKGRSRVKQPAW